MRPFLTWIRRILDTSSKRGAIGSVYRSWPHESSHRHHLIPRTAAVPALGSGRVTHGADGRGHGPHGPRWNAAFLEATVEDALERTIEPVCYAQALRRIAYHKSIGDVVVIASASVEQVVRPIATMLGADEVLASKAALDEDGCFTGEVTHFNQAQSKADACEALARSRGWDLSECSGVLGFGVGCPAAAPRRPPLRGQSRPRAARNS